MYVICILLQAAIGSLLSGWSYGSRFQGNLQHREMPQVEKLPPPVSADRALALASPTGAVAQGCDLQVEQELVDTLMEGFSRDDPPPLDLEDKLTKEVATGESQLATKWRIA